MGGLFAPAFIRGFKPSEDATDKWAADRAFSRQDVENTRMPYPWQAPQAVNPMQYASGSGYIGGGLPTRQTFGDARGMVDPNALLSQAQGIPYDKEARRQAIAAQVASNQAASDSYAQQHLARYGYLPNEEARGPFAGAGPQGGNTMYANMEGYPSSTGDTNWRQAQMTPHAGYNPNGLNAPGFGQGMGMMFQGG